MAISTHEATESQRSANGRGMRIPLAWLLSAAVLVATAIHGLFFAGSHPHAATGRSASSTPREEEHTDDPMQQIRSVDVFSPLAEDQPLRFGLNTRFDSPLGIGRQTLFFYSHPHFQGVLTAAAVATLIDARRADSLEHRLSPPHLERLRSMMSEYDAAIRDLALVIREEEGHIKRGLSGRNDRCFDFSILPRESDPGFPRFYQMQPGPNDGVVLSEPLAPRGERVFVVLWTEWPGLNQLYADRFAMIADRRRRVSQWVAQEFRTLGLALFDS